ncbi:unnamed protein product [Rotaria sp. Silwood2]|nr:unnamed protein product [Rotaria sp. Silwood2]
MVDIEHSVLAQDDSDDELHRGRRKDQATADSIIPNNLSFAYLDVSVGEYASFRQNFCQKTGCNSNLWANYTSEDQFKAFIKSGSVEKKILLISTGRQCANIIKDIHSLPQLHSVYIYCQVVANYESLRKEYSKLRGVFSKPDLLLTRICNDLEAETLPKAPMQTRREGERHTVTSDIISPADQEALIERARKAATPPKQNQIPTENGVEVFSQPGIHKCPWNANSCTKTLPVKGQGTVAVMELEPMPFELCLSSKPNPDDPEAFSIILGVDTTGAFFGTNKKTYDQSHIPQHLIQPNNGKWHTYWLSFFKDTRKLRYGIGEIRSMFSIFEITIEEDMASELREIHYLHVKFPDFTRAVDRSVKDPNGWCHKKLVAKANRFGRPNFYATYLRVTVGNRDGSAPGHKYVVEIWPPGHYSPIHNHSNAYGIIKVLCGRLLVKLYPELSLNVRQYSPIETLLEEGQITWMLPRLNQTHQVRNPDLYGACSISIQCYQYGEEDEEHYEYFDYLNNDGQSIGQFNPKNDDVNCTVDLRLLPWMLRQIVLHHYPFVVVVVVLLLLRRRRLRRLRLPLLQIVRYYNYR